MPVVVSRTVRETLRGREVPVGGGGGGGGVVRGGKGGGGKREVLAVTASGACACVLLPSPSLSASDVTKGHIHTFLTGRSDEWYRYSRCSLSLQRNPGLCLFVCLPVVFCLFVLFPGWKGGKEGGTIISRLQVSVTHSPPQ